MSYLEHREELSKWVCGLGFSEVHHNSLHGLTKSKMVALFYTFSNLGGTAPLTKNWHVLCSISKLPIPFRKIIYESYSKLSKELKTGIEIIVGQAVF